MVESLNGQAAQISIVDGNGNVLATGVSGATNVSQSIEDFVAPSTGTYYVEITGDPGLQYSVVVTRGADFTLQPHNSYDDGSEPHRHERRAGLPRTAQRAALRAG